LVIGAKNEKGKTKNRKRTLAILIKDYYKQTR